MDGVVLRLGVVDDVGRCSGVGRWTAWGGAAVRGGAPVARGEGLASVEMNFYNFNPRLFYSSSSSLPVLLVNRQ